MTLSISIQVFRSFILTEAGLSTKICNQRKLHPAKICTQRRFPVVRYSGISILTVNHLYSSKHLAPAKDRNVSLSSADHSIGSINSCHVHSTSGLYPLNFSYPILTHNLSLNRLCYINGNMPKSHDKCTHHQWLKVYIAATLLDSIVITYYNHIPFWYEYTNMYS